MAALTDVEWVRRWRKEIYNSRAPTANYYALKQACVDRRELKIDAQTAQDYLGVISIEPIAELHQRDIVDTTEHLCPAVAADYYWQLFKQHHLHGNFSVELWQKAADKNSKLNLLNKVSAFVIDPLVERLIALRLVSLDVLKQRGCFGIDSEIVDSADSEIVDGAILGRNYILLHQFINNGEPRWILREEKMRLAILCRDRLSMKILNYTRPSDVISQNNLALACLNGVLDALPHYAETEEYYVNVAAALTLYTAAPIPLEIQGSVIDRLPAPLTMRLIKVGMGLSGRRKMRQLVMMTHNLSYLRDMYPTISKYSAGYVGGVVNDVRGMLSGYLAADPTGIVVQYLWTNCF